MKKQDMDDKHINDPLSMEALKRNPFLVPESYFSTLQQEIQLRKRISELGESSFITPEDYQDHLRQDILSKVSEQKLKEQIPNSMSGVPAGYFNDLQKRILSQTVGNKIEQEQYNEPSQGKPVKRLGIRKWIPYAAAASITVAIGLFAILDGVKTSQHKQATDYFAQIETVPTDEIINYLASYTEPGDLQHLSEQLQDRTGDLADDLSAQEIEAYLEYSL